LSLSPSYQEVSTVLNNCKHLVLKNFKYGLYTLLTMVDNEFYC